MKRRSIESDDDPINEVAVLQHTHTHTHILTITTPVYEGGAGNGATRKGRTMMMSSVFFCLTVSLLIPLFARSNDPPLLPHTGKLSKGN